MRLRTRYQNEVYNLRNLGSLLLNLDSISIWAWSSDYKNNPRRGVRAVIKTMWELTLKKSSGIYVAYRLEVLIAHGRCSGNILCGITYRRILEEAAANSNQSDIFQRGEYEHVQSSNSGSLRQLKTPSSSEKISKWWNAALHEVTYTQPKL